MNSPSPPRLVIAVCGASVSTPEQDAWAEEVGRLLAGAGATVVCGGLGGVMESVARGARSAGGKVLGILPGSDSTDANAFVDVAIPTGLGEMRNGLVVRAAQGVIAIGGGYGTLSEIALALRAGLPVIGLHMWSLTPPDGGTTARMVEAAGPAQAVDLVLHAVRSR